MSIIKDGTLYSLDQSDPPFKADGSLSVVDIILGCVRSELQSRGDRVYIKEADDGSVSTNVIKERMLSEVVPMSVRVARGLIKKGLRRGDVVQLAMHHNTDYHMVMLGVWMAGGVAALTDPTLVRPVMAGLLEKTRPRFVFCTADVAEDVIRALKDNADTTTTTVITINSSSFDAPKNTMSFQDFANCQEDMTDEEEMPDVHKQVSPDDPATIFCSSGSTGNPKPVRWSHRAVILALTNPSFAGQRTNSTYVTTTCFFHVIGSMWYLANGLCRGCTMVFFSYKQGLNMERFFETCHKYRPNSIAMGAHQAAQLANSDLPSQVWNLDSVRFLLPIGAPLNDDITVKIQKRFPRTLVAIVYGGIEVGSVAMSNTYDNLGSVLRGMEVRIADVETRTILGPNRVGEILIKGESMMSGYLGVRKDVAQSSPFTNDGFFPMGDLGYYDQSGQLFYKERLKFVIKHANLNVYPHEIEDVVLTIPGVADVGVFGLLDQDSQEQITAAVVKIPGCRITGKEVLEYVNERVQSYQWIRGGVHFVESIPRNSMGKVLRGQLSGLI